MAERYMQLEDWLDDLCVRFIINLPQDNLSSVERICFQIEEAQWFYEDFIRPLDPNLPSLSLRNFSLRMFAHCPLLSAFAVGGRHMQAFEEFLAYKNRIPVRGAIMLNEAMDSTVLVKGWKKGANWSFPRGKINKDEDDLICAVREVYEETGLDLEVAGLIPQDRNVKYIEINIRDQQMRLYVFRNVPMSTHFEPRTRKEISKIQWWPLSDLPSFKKKNQNIDIDPALNANKFYMVAPFLAPLRKWINQQKQSSLQYSNNHSIIANQDDLLTEDDRENLEYQAPYEVSAPESTSVDDAGEMLSRLLNVQPSRPTDQPQLPEPSSGSALLALLQSNPAESFSRQPPPETPLGQLVDAASVPVTPHHHHQHHHPHARATDLPPPPHFPIQPLGNTHPQLHLHLDQQQQPKRSVYVQQPQTQPVYYASPHHNQPQHLIHPQPLPPNVQKAVFNNGIIPSPPVPQSMPQPQATWNGQILNSVNFSAPKNVGPPIHMLPVSQRQPPPQLNNHSIALLNAFKSGGPSLTSSVNQEPQYSQPQPITQTSVAHPHELPADLARATVGKPVPSISQSTTAPNSIRFLPRQEVSSAQKSALLDMFKSPTTQAALTTRPSAATALPVGNTPSAVELSAVEPVSTTPHTLAKSQVQRSAPNGKMPELDPETARSFRPVSILSRSQATGSRSEDRERRSAKIPSHQPHTQQRAPASRKEFVTSQAASDKIFAPQILKRPQAGEPIDVSKMFKSPPTAANVLYGTNSPIATTANPIREQAPQHKMNLLSLFGKAPSNTTSNEQGSPTPILSQTSKIDLVSAMSPLDPSSKSRMGSIVSAEALSRRGSSSTMSKANENFLLGYLDAVAGGSNR